MEEKNVYGLHLASILVASTINPGFSPDHTEDTQFLFDQR